MRISDWSSDVCSSDLGTDVAAGTPLFQIDASDYKAQLAQAEAMLQRAQAVQKNAASVAQRFRPLVSRQAVSAQEYEAALAALGQIGRASCRERVCQYV